MSRIPLVILGLIVAVATNAALAPIKYTDFPNTNVFGLTDLFLFAKTNIANPTNYSIKGSDLINQLSNAIPTSSTNFYTTNTIINTNMAGGGESLWTNRSGFVQLINADTNTIKISTNGLYGVLIGDTNRASVYDAWPRQGLKLLIIQDGTTGHTPTEFSLREVDGSTNVGEASLVAGSGLNPQIVHTAAVRTNGITVSDYILLLRKTGGYLEFGDSSRSNMVGFQNAGQLSSAIGPNHIRIKSHGAEKMILSTNGDVSFFGSHTNYGNLHAKSNFVVSGSTLLHDPLIVNDSALFLIGLASAGLSNTIGFQSLGRITLGNNPADLTVSSNMFRQYGQMHIHDDLYLQNSALTSGRVLYLDALREVQTATFTPAELSTIANMMNASNILAGLIGSGGSGAAQWTNDSLSVFRVIATSTNFVGGGTGNIIATNNSYSTISGGQANEVRSNATYAAVGGGLQNIVSPFAIATTVSGGRQNTASTNYASVSGGFLNVASGRYNSIGGGLLNSSSGDASTVSGGESNLATGNHSTVGGGLENFITFKLEGGNTIGGGKYSTVRSDYGTVAGGFANDNVAPFSTIGGGYLNILNGNNVDAASSGIGAGFGTIGGGSQNRLGFVGTASPYSFIGGGRANAVHDRGTGSTIAGGMTNTIVGALGMGSFIGGGAANQVGVIGETASSFGTVVGGYSNIVGSASDYSTAGGGLQNTLKASYSVIGGGALNSISNNAEYSAIGGGEANLIEGNLGGYVVSGGHAVIAGGIKNTNSALMAVIGGGYLNTIQSNAYLSVIAGGSFSIIGTNSANSVIGGGSLNSIGSFSQDSVIGGGGTNQIGIGSSNSVIVGGFGNIISNNTPNAVAIGRNLSVGTSETIELGMDVSRINKVRIDSTNMWMLGGMQFRMTNDAGEGKVATSDSLGRMRWAAGGSGGSGSMTNVTNSIWVDAGAMRATHGSTAEGGLVGASVGYWTNAISIWDVWDFDDTTNECVQFRTTLDQTFTGPLSIQLHWAITNTLNGASNIVWGLAATPLATNNLAGQWIYVTNKTDRFWSSNSLQITTMPTITLTNYSPRHLIDFRISRLGTNTADAALGDARLLGAQISYITSQ